MNRPNDWFATLMYNQPSSFEEVIANGITPDNSSIQSADYYKELEPVKEVFTKDGKFDDVAFNNFYTSALNMYNTFSNEDWENKLIEEMAKDPLDWTQPMKTNVKEVKVTVGNGYNPERRSMGIAGIKSVGDPVFSAREIAQGNYVRDENGNKLDWTPNQKHGLIRSLFLPSAALAIWDEDGTHMVNGMQVQHRKGDLRVDDDGDYFYEVLGNKEAYGREFLKWSDLLTVDGTTLNKFDPFDSDGLSKSVGKVIASTTLKIAPLLIPGIGQTYGTISVFTSLAEVLPTISKGINGIITGDSNNAVGKNLTWLENVMGRFGDSVSDKGSQNFANLENIGNILTSSAGQLYSQKQLAKLTQMLSKGREKLISSNLGQKLSLGWMAITSSQEAYGSMKEAGASDRAAGIGMLASMAALYGLMNQDYFRDQLFKGTFMDETETIDVMKNWIAENSDKINTLAKAVDTKEANIGLFNTLKNYAIKLYNKTPWLGKKESLASKGLTTAWNAGKKIVNRSVNEGIEEMMEETSSDAIKALMTGADALGIPVRENAEKPLDFGFDLSEMLKRYATTFVGGALGGATFEGIELFNKHIGPRIVELSDLESNRQMTYLIATGHADEMRDRAKVLYDKGLLGNKNLSALETTLNSDNVRIYAQGTENDNQNLWNYRMLVNHINYLENTLQNHGISSKFMFQIDAATGLPTTINEKYAEEFKKQQKVEDKEKIDSQEYTYRNKENALTKVIEAYKMDTTYVNDIVDLGTKIIEAQAKLDILTAGSPAITDSSRNTETPNIAKSEEIKFWKERLKALQEERTNLVTGANNDIYAHQALFTTQKAINEPFIGGVKTGNPEIDRIYGSSYWAASKEGYVKSKYGRDWNTLNNSEKDIMEKEYNEFQASTGVDRLIKASKMHYTLLENSSDQINRLNELLKDKNLDNWFKHGLIAGYSTEFTQFENDQIKLLENSQELEELQKQKIELSKGKTVEEIASSKEIQEINNRILNLTVESDAINTRSQEFIDKYGDYESNVLNESLTDLGWNNFYSSIRSNLNNIKNYQDYILNKIKYEQLIGEINDGEDNIAELEESVKHKRGSVEELDEQKILLDSLKAVKKSYEDRFDLSVDVDTANKEIEKSYTNLLDTVKQLYIHLHDNNIVSENDAILKSTLETIVTPISLNFNQKFEDAFEDSFEGLSDSNAEFLTKHKGEIKQKALDFISDIKNGKLESAIDKYNALDSWLEDLFKENHITVYAGRYAFHLINSLTFGLDLIKFLDEINTLKAGITPFSAIDLVRDFNLNLDDTVLKAIEVIESEQDSFMKSMNKDEYLINNETYKKALEQIPSLITMMSSILSSSYNGMSEALNSYREVTGKSLLADNLDENTKNIIESDFNYLLQKTQYLLDLSQSNRNNRKDFHKKSEIKIKTDFIKNLFFAKEAEDSIANKLKKINIDVEKAWKEACSDNEINIESVTQANFKEFNTAFIKFCDILYESARPEDPSISEKERLNTIGDIIASILPDDSFKMISGEITDNTEQVLPMYSTVVYLASILTVKSSKFLTALKEVEFSDTNKYVPIIGQEWNTQLACSLVENSTIFDKIISKLVEQNNKYAESLSGEKQTYILNKSLLEKFMFIQGGLGSGKTSVVIKYISEILDKWYDDCEIIYAAPQDTQIENLKTTLGIEDKNLIQVAALMEKIYPDYSKLPDYDTSVHVEKANPNDINITTKSDVLFAKKDSKKVIIIDELTFIPEKQLQILSKWAKINNVTIIGLGDRKQNGAHYSGTNTENRGKTTGIEDCLFITGPELTESIRMSNIAKVNNLRSLVVPIKKVLNFYRDNPASTSNELDKVFSDIVAANKTNDTAIKLQYYESESSFAGERFINANQIETYIDKFVNLSTKLHEGEVEGKRKPRVALITEGDGGRWKDKNITIINSERVQGGEYDFVIIDKKFDLNSGLFASARDFYTLIGRSKYGTAIVGAKDLQDKLGIITSEVDKSIKDAPITFVDDADSFIEWKKSLLESIEISKEETTKPEENPEPELTREEKEIAAVSAYLGSDSDENNEKALIETTPIVKDFDTLKEEAIKNDEKSKKGTKKTKKRETAGKYTYDRGNFIEFVDSDAFLDSEKSNENSLLDLITDSKLQKLVRYFSSAVMFNMDLGGDGYRELLESETTVDSDIINDIITRWQIDDSRKYIARTNGITSIIYYRTLIRGKEYDVPVAQIDNVVEGELTLPRNESLFEQTVTSMLVKTEDHIPFLKAMTHGKMFGEVRIFAPTDDSRVGIDDASRNKNKEFRDLNNGKTFIIWSESELVTDEDLQDLFKYRKDASGNKIYYLNVDPRLNTTSSNDSGDLVYTLKNGAQVRLINVHREISLGYAYDVVNIMRFVSGRCTYDSLTEHQKLLIENKNDKVVARDFLKSIFGDLRLNLGSAVDAQTQKQIIAKNLYDLSTKYKLLSSNSQRYFLNALYTSLRKLETEDPTWLTGFTNNIIHSIYREPRQSKTTGSKTQIGLRIDFRKNDNYKEYESFFVKYRADGKKGYLDIYQYNPKAKTKDRLKLFDTIEATGVDNKFDTIINTINRKIGSNLKKSKKISELLDDNDVIIQFLQEAVSETGGIFYNEPNDYDYIFATLNNIKRLDFNKIEEKFRENKQFKHGIYVNDKGTIYQVGAKKGSDESSETVWRKTNLTTSAQIQLMSNIANITASAFTLSRDFTKSSSPINTTVNDDTIVPTPVVNNKEKISKFRENLVSSLETYNVDLDSNIIDRVISKYENEEDAEKLIIDELNKIVYKKDLILEDDGQISVIDNPNKFYKLKIHKALNFIPNILQIIEYNTDDGQRHLVICTDKDNKLYHVVFREDNGDTVVNDITKFFESIKNIKGIESYINELNPNNLLNFGYTIPEYYDEIDEYVGALSDNTNGITC